MIHAATLQIVNFEVKRNMIGDRPSGADDCNVVIVGRLGSKEAQALCRIDASKPLGLRYHVTEPVRKRLEPWQVKAIKAIAKSERFSFSEHHNGFQIALIAPCDNQSRIEAVEDALCLLGLKVVNRLGVLICGAAP